MIFHLLLVSVVLAPLPFGSVYQWSWAGLAVIVAILLLIWLMRLVSRPDLLSIRPKRIWFPAALFALAVMWTALQAAPWVPAAWHHPMWPETTQALQAELVGYVALDPDRTASAVVRLLTLAGVFWLSAQLCRGRERAILALHILSGAAVLYAAYGIWSDLSGANTVLWFENRTGHRAVTSTFINRNMYVAYAGFGFLIILALLMDRWLGRTNHGSASLAFVDLIKRNPNASACLFAAGLIVLMALTLTGSRGGFLACMAGVVVLFLCFAIAREKARRGTLLWPLIVLLTLVGLGFLVSGGVLGGRLSDIALDTNERLSGYAMILGAVRDAPFSGFGYRNFLEVFYLYNDGSLFARWGYSQNMYLGLAVELGLPAALCLLGSVGLVVHGCVGGLRRRRQGVLFPALCAATTCLVAVHGLVDAPLFIPANAVTFSFILGLAYAQSRAPNDL